MQLGAVGAPDAAAVGHNDGELHILGVFACGALL